MGKKRKRQPIRREYADAIVDTEVLLRLHIRKLKTVADPSSRLRYCDRLEQIAESYLAEAKQLRDELEEWRQGDSDTRKRVVELMLYLGVVRKWSKSREVYDLKEARHAARLLASKVDFDEMADAIDEFVRQQQRG